METPEKGNEATLPVLTPKTAGGSQRVIKQIMVIDPNKLRLAGLDVKMAEALKKSKKKSQPKSKESKLAAAKSLLNKKLKEAIFKKDSAKATPPKTPQKSVSSIEEAVRILSSSEKNKGGKGKPKISVTNLKSLMPPPSFPVSSLISPNQTVEIKVLKSDKTNTKQSIEVKIVDSCVETPQKIDQFPKASLKSPETPKTVKTLSVSPENKIEATKNLATLEGANEPQVSAQPKKETSQTVIVYMEEKKNTQKPRKGSLKEKNISGSDHSESLTNSVEPSQNKSPKVVHWESPPHEEKSFNEKTNLKLGTNQKESLVVGVKNLFEMAPPKQIRAETLSNTVFEMTPSTQIRSETLSNISESSLKITTSTPIRRESLPKVIESKVLKPDEKIDLSILTKKSPAALTVPKKRYKLDQNWITSESNQAESVYINLPPVSNPTPPPKPAAQESAVDFINNLSLFFAESPANKSHNKSVPDILTKECGEDATSFLVSLFQKKHDAPPNTQSTPSPVEKNEGLNAAAIKEQCTTNDIQIGQTISKQDSSPKTSSDTTHTQVSDIKTNNSPNNENKTNKNIQLVKTVDETTLDGPQSLSLILDSEKPSIQDKSIVSTPEKGNNSIEPIGPTELPSDLTKAVSNETYLSAKEDNRLPDVSSSLTTQTASVNESLQESVPKLSTPPVSSRRKASKPMPVLIPKLKKSRKPPTSALKPPEDTIPQKSTEKPKEESPTQPVQNKEAFDDSIPSESTPFETEGVRKELADENTQVATQKTERKQRNTSTSIAESPTSSMPSLDSKNAIENFDELPVTNKTERPQRQRKISVKLIESSEFAGVVNRTIEQIIKKTKASTTTPTDRPQRQRKISFKISNSSESLITTTKSPIQAPSNSNAQDTKEKIELATTTGRPQRQRKISLKLLESSESVPIMKSLGQVKNRTVEPEIKDKLQLEKNTENTNSDNLIAIEVENESLKDPLAQLAAFHETVEQFEMACGSVKPNRTQNTPSNLKSEGHSLSEYPFYDAICSEISSEQVQQSTLTEGKENVSEEKNSKKVLRKRKDSLKSRTFAGEQISIVSSDSLDIAENTSGNIEHVPSKKQTSKRKETHSFHQSESEENQEMFEYTPKQTETKAHARNLVSEMAQNDDKFSIESKEMLNNSGALENLNDTPSFSMTPESTNIETPINTSGKKRRGRPPKVKKHFPNLRVGKNATETSQPITSNSSIQPITVQIGESRDTLPSTDEIHLQEVKQVEVVDEHSEVTPTTQSNTIVISKNSNLGGSLETLPSADEHLSQEFIKKSTSQSAKKQRGKFRLNSFSLKSITNKDNVDEIPEVNRSIEKNPNKEENVLINAEDEQKIVNILPEDVVMVEESETAKPTKKRGRPPKALKQYINRNEDQTGINKTPKSMESEVSKKYGTSKTESPPTILNISQNKTEPITLHEIEFQEEKPSTSKSMKIVEILPKCKMGLDISQPIKETPQKTQKSIETSETALSQAIKTFSYADKTLEINPVEPSKVQSLNDQDNSPDCLKMTKTSIDIGNSHSEPRISENQNCETHNSPKDSVIIELKSPIKVKESEHDRDVEIDKLELVPETLQLNSCEPFKTSQLKLADSLEPSKVSETAIEHGDLCDLDKLPEKSIHSETLYTDSSAIHTDHRISQISKEQSMPKDDFFDKLKLPKAESKVNESRHPTDLPKTKEPPKIVPHFEDLMFDVDHIESPSFSPICDSSRISNDSDGFEEFDEDFTSAVINTVTEAEKFAENPVSVEEQAVEKSLNSSLVVGENFNKDSEPTQKLESSFLEHNNSDIVEQSPGRSSETPKSTESPKSDGVKENSASQSSELAIEEPIFDKPSSSLLNISEKTLEDHVSSDPKIPEDAKQIEQPTSSDDATLNSDIDPHHMTVAGPDKVKETQNLNSNVFEKKSPNKKSNSGLNSSDLAKKSPKIPKSTEDSKSEKIEKSSALFKAIHNKSEQKETRKNKAKNPFKMQKSKDNDSESGTRSQTDFLGFNEEEIEEGQQSTSLRLSQSEDAESLNIDSPSTSNKQLKHNIKESQSSCGKKQKGDQQKWEKNSAKSLKNWLSKPVKSSSTDDICDIKEKCTKEPSSSVPLKKRRSKVQNITEPIPLEKDVEHHLQEEINIADISIKSVNASVIEESSNSSDNKEKPKRGRKPKLKNVSKTEQSLSESVANSTEDLNSTVMTPIIKKPKRGRKSKVTYDDEVDDDEYKTPRRSSKSKISDQSIDTTAKKEKPENIPTPIKAKGRKRKRSVSEENTPTTAEPPTKAAHFDGYSNIFSTVRKPGRPKKSEVHGPSAVAVANVSIEETTPKHKVYKDDTEFNPRLLLIRKKEELKSNEPLVDPNLQTEPTAPDDVQCALCMGYTPKQKWIQHVSTHYGIGWIVGKPPPLNINSRGSVLSFLLEFYKVSKVKGLNCRLCNSLRRSALGLLGHLEQCCLTEEEISSTRIVCEYCKRNYTKSSYLVHKRTCTDYLKQVLEEAKAENISEIPEGTATNDVLSNTGRFKRKAVIKAETMLKKLEVETTEFSPDDLIKCIPKKNIQSIEAIKERWHMDINSFGKGFCASRTCRFTATDIDDLIDHYQETVCPYYEKSGYFCVRCKFHSENIELVRFHVTEKHSPKPSRQKNDSDAEVDSSESSDSGSSGDDEAESESGGVEEVDENGERKPKRKKKQKKAKKRRFQPKNPPTKEYKKLLPDRSPFIHEIVAQFYDKFIETNYSLDPLFTFAKTNPISIEASESYFPKSANSIKFIHNGFNGFVKSLGSSKVQPDQWKQLERLHGMTENCEYTIYMGGPVKNIAWVPLDPHPPSNTQYLAVTVRKGLDKFTRFINQKFSRSLIFILKLDIRLPSEIKANIIYAIAIDEGPIHAIEFLPSGGYSPEMNRLGILAVGTIETEIKIYSLPIRVEKLDCDLFPIVRLKPAIELHLETLDNPSDKTNMYSSQCICLLWSQAAGHNIIVGSFLNGFVGIWDISDTPDNLNRYDLNEIKRFTPVSYFWTSEDRLMHMALHYDMNGPRWLAISNSTRKMMLYDLRDITQPILFRVEVTINIINCIEWPLAWENIMFGLGDTMPSNGCVVSAFSPMAIMFQVRRFEKFCSGVTDLHFNIWRNCFAAGTDNGDVQVTPVREAVLDVAQRLKIDEKIISTLDIVPFNGEPISQSGIQIPSDGLRVFDKDHKDQYGIVFGSIQKIKGCNKPDYYNTKRVPPLNLHRLTRVSKIRFNQNKNACDVLAIGYNNGLLRIKMHDWIKKG